MNISINDDRTGVVEFVLGHHDIDFDPIPVNDVRSDLQTQHCLFEFDLGNSGDSASGRGTEGPLLAAFDDRRQLVEGRDRGSRDNVELTVFLKGGQFGVMPVLSSPSLVKRPHWTPSWRATSLFACTITAST